MGDRGTVMIVGAAGGIGRAASTALARAGYLVLAADISAARLKELPDPGIRTEVLDMCDRSAVRELAGRLSVEGARLAGLVVAAAVHSTHPAALLPDDLVDRVIDVNLVSHVKLVRDFLPLMAPGGTIVGVSSIAAIVGVPMSSLYSASKRGLEGFYESLRNEVRHDRIRVSVIQPGNVDTGFNETGNTYEPSGDGSVDAAYRTVVSRIDSRLGMPPARVARDIVRAITSRRPRFRYVTGMNAVKAWLALRLLGDDAALSLMALFFRPRVGK
jgi:NAD(P)-dependent dehydrogenase (short-subunit alcohol dehydrogenase family)